MGKLPHTVCVKSTHDSVQFLHSVTSPFLSCFFITYVEDGDNCCCSAVLANLLGARGSPFLCQPLCLDPSSRLNHRKLTELPHALAQQGRIDELKELLCSLQWQQATITGFSSSDLVAEFSNLVPVIPENR